MAPNKGGIALQSMPTEARTFELRKKDLDHPALRLDKMRAAIPKEAFVKSVGWSLFHMAFDYGMWMASLYCIIQFNNSDYYATAPEWQKWAATLAFWNVSGFFMWGIFVVGHDCGHGTFSKNKLFNDIIGHICHASIMVPFYPWALSHRRHHMYHNHVDKDYSHPWYTPDKLEKPEFGLARMMEKAPWLRATFPFYGWAVYLWGMPDGSHFVPMSFTGAENNRLWNESKELTQGYSDHINCIISSSTVFAAAAAILHMCDWNWNTFAYYYLASALVYGWWLVTVTYLQHHDHSTEVFDDKDWNFVYSAFETIDRKFGFGLDYLHHHITDGHIAHHLFFTSIPHYNLPIATQAIYEYMAKNGLGHMVKRDQTQDFFLRVHSYFVEFGFAAKRFGWNAGGEGATGGARTKKAK